MQERHSVAEVVARDGRVRLRLGFRAQEGLYAETDLAQGPGQTLEPGCFIAHQEGEPVLTAAGEVLVVAEAGTALADIHRIAARAGLDLGWKDAELLEARAICADLRTDDPDLVDLRAMPLVTIDYQRSRDLDQAVHVERRGDSFVVHYALADAGAYIKPGSALLEKALARGTSFYLPGLTVPMLPRSLSEGAVSLNEAVDRRAFVFRIEIDGAGAVAGYELFSAVIRSRAKLTYDGVQAFIDDEDRSPLAGAEFAQSLRELRAVGELRIAEADTRDVIRYDRIATRLTLPNKTSPVLEVAREERNGAQKWNEQISLVTNTVGAAYLMETVDDSTGIAGLFRVHPHPDASDLDHLETAIADLIETRGLSDSWRWDRQSETLAAYIDRLPDEGDAVRLSCALQRQAMILGRPSTFSTEAAPHFGVGAAAYSRFSSPMREVVGIVTMLIALAQQRGETLADVGLTEETIRAAVNAGNRANRLQKQLTRECDKLAIDQLFSAEKELERDARPIRAATVMGVTESKIYLQLDDPPIEVKLYVPDQARMLGSALELESRFELASDTVSIRVGDAVHVQVDEYASARERWVLRLVPKPEARTAR